MAEYKVGDKVRIVSKEGSHGYSIGDIVTIKVDDGSEYLPFKCGEYWVGHKHIEPYTDAETGTLAELNVRDGDVLECVEEGLVDGYIYPHNPIQTIVNGRWCGMMPGTSDGTFRIISRASDDTPKTWGEMTDAEKGALLLAAHEGKVIEYYSDALRKWRETVSTGPSWYDAQLYRIKPEPKRETVELYNDRNCGWSFYEDCGTYKRSHRITFDLIDGKPIPGTYTNENGDTIKMEEL